jgi:hypothetical protein
MDGHLASYSECHGFKSQTGNRYTEQDLRGFPYSQQTNKYGHSDFHFLRDSLLILPGIIQHKLYFKLQAAFLYKL